MFWTIRLLCFQYTKKPVKPVYSYRPVFWPSLFQGTFHTTERIVGYNMLFSFHAHKYNCFINVTPCNKLIQLYFSWIKYDSLQLKLFPELSYLWHRNCFPYYSVKHNESFRQNNTTLKKYFILYNTPKTTKRLWCPYTGAFFPMDTIPFPSYRGSVIQALESWFILANKYLVAPVLSLSLKRPFLIIKCHLEKQARMKKLRAGITL